MGDHETKYQILAAEEDSGDPDPEGFKDVRDYVEHCVPIGRTRAYTRKQGAWKLAHSESGLQLFWEASSQEESIEEKRAMRKVVGTNNMRSIMGSYRRDWKNARFIMNNGHYVDITVQKCTITFNVSSVYVDICGIKPKTQKQVKTASVELPETRSETTTGEGSRPPQPESSSGGLRQRATLNVQSCG